MLVAYLIFVFFGWVLYVTKADFYYAQVFSCVSQTLRNGCRVYIFLNTFT